MRHVVPVIPHVQQTRTSIDNYSPTDKYPKPRLSIFTPKSLLFKRAVNIAVFCRYFTRFLPTGCLLSKWLVHAEHKVLQVQRQWQVSGNVSPS